MIIAVSSTSAIQPGAVEELLKELPLEGEVLRLNAGEEDQVFGFDKLVEGARTKAQQALDLQKADIGIGVENGLVQVNASGWFDAVCVAALTKEQKESVNFSVGFLIPDWVVNEIKQKNAKLSTIIERLSGGKESEPIRYFSNGTLAREDTLRNVLFGALSKIVNHDRYHL